MLSADRRVFVSQALSVHWMLFLTADLRVFVSQALSVRWTERSLQELRRCRPGQQAQDQDQDQERRQLQDSVRQMQRWLEDTYRDQLQQLHAKLHQQKDELLQVITRSECTAGSIRPVYTYIVMLNL